MVIVPLKSVIDLKANEDEKWFFSQKAVDGMLKPHTKAKMNKGRAQNLDEPCQHNKFSFIKSQS